jgi:hypothetical protein
VYNLGTGYRTTILFIWLSNLSTLNEPDEGYSRNAPCAFNFDIYVFIWGTLGVLVIPPRFIELLATS